MKTMEYTFKITVQDDVIAQILFDMLKGLRGTKIEPIMPIENPLSEDYVSFVNDKIGKSEEDIANGRVYEHLEVKTMIESWKNQ
jgi:predicted transcriptional regulator